jgi:hypothetical protein
MFIIPQFQPKWTPIPHAILMSYSSHMRILRKFPDNVRFLPTLCQDPSLLRYMYSTVNPEGTANSYFNLLLCILML